MKYNKNDFIFIPVGGSESIGMNSNLYHYNDKWILIDLGISFPDETQLGVDILLPDFTFIKNLKDKLLGIFLTHGHEDHFGAIPYFAKEINCPIWGTEFTIALLRRKLKESNMNLKLNTIPKSGNIKVGNFLIECIKASHSIPQAISYLVKTKNENIFHTGDWKFEPAENLNEKSNIDILNKISKSNISCVISDSTNALVEGRTPSESLAFDGLYKLIKTRKGCVLITCFSSNISRIKSLITIANKLNKKICIVGRALKRAVDAAIETGILPRNFISLSEKDIKNLNRRDLMIICSGSQGESNSALSRISAERHERISLFKGDTVIFSSRKIPGNENAILKIEERLFEKEIEVINDERDIVHVSGHPAREEIIEIYNLLKPLSVIPVHGNRLQLEENANLAKTCQINNVLLPKNGHVIKINKGTLSVIGKYEMDVKVYDGGTIVSLDDERFTVRKHVLWNGIVTASIVINEKGEMLTVPKLTQSGVSDTYKMKNILLEISLMIEDFFEKTISPEILDDEYLEKEIKKIIVKKIKNIFTLRPLTNIHINRLI